MIYDVYIPLNFYQWFETGYVIDAGLLAKYFALANGAVPPEWPQWYGFNEPQQVVFCVTLLFYMEEYVDLAIIEAIDSCYDLTHSIDPEILQHWYSLGLYKNYLPAVEAAQQWIS